MSLAEVQPLRPKGVAEELVELIREVEDLIERMTATRKQLMEELLAIR